MLLRHRRLGALEDVVDQLAGEGQRDVLAVDVAGLLLIDQEQVAAALAPGDVHVLADLDEAVGAEDGQAPVAPRAQALWREPVDADVAGAAVAADHAVAEVLEAGLVGVVQVADLRGDDLRLGGSGEEQELVELVRGDVGEDAAVLFLDVEPVGPPGPPWISRWGPRPTVWITLPIAPACTSSPAFTVARFSCRSLYITEKIRFVWAWTLRTSASCASVVIAGLSERKSLPAFITRMPSGARSLAMAALATSAIRLSSRISCSLFASTAFGIALGERGGEVRLLGVEADQLAAGADERLAHPVDVAVVHADRGEPDARLAGRLGGRRLGLGGVAPPGGQHQRGGRDGRGRERRLQERASVGVLGVHASMSPLRPGAGPPACVNAPLPGPR